MFSGVGKAKEHVFQLATQLLLQGSAAGAAIPHHHHHHHHHHHNHHARQLSTAAGTAVGIDASGSSICLSPSTVHSPCQQQHAQQQQLLIAQTGGTTPELSLEDVSLFRMGELRLLFLARCCQLHALTGKSHLVLPAQAFETLTDALRVILREGNNEGDYLSARLVYAVSDMVGRYTTGGKSSGGGAAGGAAGRVHLQTARGALRRHEAWANPELYKAALEECVARDKQQWLGLQAPLQQLLGLDDGGAFRGEDVIRLLLLLRLRAIAEAILQLRGGVAQAAGQPPEHEALVQGLLDHVRQEHGQHFTLEEVCAPPAAPFVLWLLDAATRLLAPDYKGAAFGSGGETDPEAVLSHSNSRRADTLRRGPGGASGGAASSSLPAVLRWASETARAASHWTCLGFSVHHALLHFVLAHANAPITVGATAGGVGPTAAGAASCAGGGGGLCLCGKPFYAEWRVLGGYTPETQRIQQLAPQLLCEPCFRRLLREHRLFGHAAAGADDKGPLLGASYQPQAVGCAPLPAAAAIQMPHCLAALAAAATAPHDEAQPAAAAAPAASRLSTTTTVVVGLTTMDEPSQAPPAPAPADQSSISSSSSSIPHRESIVAPRLSSSSSTAVVTGTANAPAASTAPIAPIAPQQRQGSAASDAPRAPSKSSVSFRRRSISGSEARARGQDPAMAVPPPPPRPQSTRERGRSSSISNSGGNGGPGLGVSGSGSSSASGSGGAAASRPRLRKSELFALLVSGELEVIKHASSRFAMAAAPHRRILFVDDASIEAAELRWCSKEDFARLRQGKKAAVAAAGGVRGGLPLKQLQDVKRRGLVVTLTFKTRPLVVEAFTEERAELIECIFRMVLNKNRKMTLLLGQQQM